MLSIPGRAPEEEKSERSFHCSRLIQLLILCSTRGSRNSPQVPDSSLNGKIKKHDCTVMTHSGFPEAVDIHGSLRWDVGGILNYSHTSLVPEGSISFEQRL